MPGGLLERAQRGDDRVAHRRAAARGQAGDGGAHRVAVLGRALEHGRAPAELHDADVDALGHAVAERAGGALAGDQPRGLDVGGLHRPGGVGGEHDRRALDGHRDGALRARRGDDERGDRQRADRERDVAAEPGAPGRPTAASAALANVAPARAPPAGVDHVEDDQRRQREQREQDERAGEAHGVRGRVPEADLDRLRACRRSTQLDRDLVAGLVRLDGLRDALGVADRLAVDADDHVARVEDAVGGAAGDDRATSAPSGMRARGGLRLHAEVGRARSSGP